ncbi:MAG: GNAT family N-acetyltransferase [Propionibacterium sp.]
MSDTSVTRNDKESRYEARVDGALAGFVRYEVKDDVIVLPHTEVDPAFGGKGVGSALARHALDDIRSEGTHKVVPSCPFIKGWIDKHPDYQDLVAEE